MIGVGIECMNLGGEAELLASVYPLGNVGRACTGCDHAHVD